jgi:hypothetical protein
MDTIVTETNGLDSEMNQLIHNQIKYIDLEEQSKLLHNRLFED